MKKVVLELKTIVMQYICMEADLDEKVSHLLGNEVDLQINDRDVAEDETIMKDTTHDFANSEENGEQIDVVRKPIIRGKCIKN